MEPMETFSLDPRRWRVGRVFSRNPLLRRSDRVEVIVIVLAVAMSLLALPVVAAEGNDVYETHRALYAEQARTRHHQPIGAPGSTNGAVVPTDQGVDIAPLVESIAPESDPDQFWVDEAGNSVPPPTPSSRAAYDAFEMAAVIESLVLAGMAALVVGSRWLLGRMRDAQWNRELGLLLGDGRANGSGYGRAQ